MSPNAYARDYWAERRREIANLGKNVYNLRLRSGYTQHRLASKMKVTADYIHRVELSVILPQQAMIKRFAEALGVTEGELYGRQKE